MRKLRITLAIGIMVAMATSVTNAAAGPRPGAHQAEPVLRSAQVTPPGPCYLPALTGETTRHRMKRIIRCAVALWPIPGGAKKAICVADRESHLNPAARSRTGLYLGLFQHSAAAWPSRFTSYTKPKWKLSNNALNGRSNTVVTIRMIRAAGWRPWNGAGC